MPSPQESSKDKAVPQAEDNQLVWVSSTAPDNSSKMTGPSENSVLKRESAERVSSSRVSVTSDTLLQSSSSRPEPSLSVLLKSEAVFTIPMESTQTISKSTSKPTMAQLPVTLLHTPSKTNQPCTEPGNVYH